MIKNISVLFLAFIATISVSAQTIRTDVLVIGSSAAGVSAAIQAARSGVKTVLITESSALAPVLTSDDLNCLEKIQNHYTYKSNKKTTLKDSLLSKTITLEQSSRLIKSITDSVKNLTVMLNTKFAKIEKSGKGWEVKLQNGRNVKIDVIIDATEDLSAAAKLNLRPDKTHIALSSAIISAPYSSKLYRTSVGFGYYQNPSNEKITYTIPVGILLPKDAENFIMVPRSTDMITHVGMSIGQAAGASAAYCAFFKTTTQNLNIRVTQGELLGYEAWLIPFTDIKFKDPNAMAFQHIGLSGLLKVKTVKNGSIYEMQFDTAGTVSTEDLRLPMREFYSRSQIWFADNNSDTLTIEKTISLIMFIAARGTELKPEIEKAWKKSFKFNTVFDLKRPITRREFAVLADAYLQPFNAKVDLTGKLLN